MQYDHNEYDRLALDATESTRLLLCVYAAQKHEDVLAIIECGAEPVFKPYNFARFMELENDEKHVLMENARKQFSDAQLDALTTFIITEYRNNLKKFAFHQRVTVVANIARHLCYIFKNENN